MDSTYAKRFLYEFPSTNKLLKIQQTIGKADDIQNTDVPIT